MKTETVKLMELARKYVEAAEENAALNPTSDSIQIVVVEPDRVPFALTIDNSLEAMQEIVGGYIENITVGKTEKGAQLGIVVNEEGKLIGLPFNRRIINFDILVGTFFITAYNLQGDNVSLSDEECAKIIRRFSPIEIYI